MPEMFRGMNVEVKLDGQDHPLWSGHIAFDRELPLEVAPQVASGFLHDLANKLADFGKAAALGLSPKIVEQLTGVHWRGQGGEAGG